MLADLDRVNGSAAGRHLHRRAGRVGQGLRDRCRPRARRLRVRRAAARADLAGSGDREPACPALVREGRLHPRGHVPSRSLGGRPVHRRPRHVDPPRRVAEPPLLSERALNRALLARQLLLERASLGIPEALSRLAGIQNQYAPNAYIRLWSCLEGFRSRGPDPRLRGCLGRPGHPHARHDPRGGARTTIASSSAPSRAQQREWAGRATKAPANLEPSGALARVRAEPGRRTDEAPGTGRAAGATSIRRCATRSTPTSRSCASRRRAPGSGGAPTCAPSPTTSSVREGRCRRPSRCPPPSSATSRPSGRRRSPTSRRSWG